MEEELGFVEFDYETVNGQTIIVKGETYFDEFDETVVEFKIFSEKYEPLRKSILSKKDAENIEDLIMENATEIWFESDFYDCD